MGVGNIKENWWRQNHCRSMNEKNKWGANGNGDVELIKRQKWKYGGPILSECLTKTDKVLMNRTTWRPRKG